MLLQHLKIEPDVHWEYMDAEYLPTPVFNELWRLQEFDKRMYRKFFTPLVLTAEGAENLLNLMKESEDNA